MTKRNFFQKKSQTSIISKKRDSKTVKTRHSSKDERHELTKSCSVTLDSSWYIGQVKDSLEANSWISYRLWLRERKKLENWKVSHVPVLQKAAKNGNTFEGQNGKKRPLSRNVAKKKIRCTKETIKYSETAKFKAREKEKTGGSINSVIDERKSNRIKIMNFKEKKRKGVDKKAKSSRADEAGSNDTDSEIKSDPDTSESEGFDDAESSDDGGTVVDTSNFNQKQARDLVRKIQEGRTNMRLPTQASKLFEKWQIAPSLPAVAPQYHDKSFAENPAPIRPDLRRKLRVISLFDGISTALVALKSLGLEVEKYVASEVDEDAMKCSKRNHPDIIQVGDVRSINEDNISAWGPFDLMVGGSPCNDFSRANPVRQGFTGKWGKLFFDYARILAMCKEKHEKANVESPFYWFFENVIMDQEDRDVISYTLGCTPVSIDAMYVSPMKRQRLYWSNIPGLGDPINPNPKRDRLWLQECLEPGRKARVKRIGCVTTNKVSLAQGKFLQDPVTFLGKPDRLWSVEIERCFGFPDHYTDVANLNAERRMGLLGMSWSIPCVRHLFEPLLGYFKSCHHS